MEQIIIAAISALFGGSLGAYFQYKGKHEHEDTSRTDIFEQFSEQQLKRMANAVSERDDLKAKNIRINAKLDQLSDQNDKLLKQVKKQEAQIKQQAEQMAEQAKVMAKQVKQINNLQKTVDILTKTLNKNSKNGGKK